MIENNLIKVFKIMASPITNIAITGHKDLRLEDLPKIGEKVKAKLEEIVGGNPTDFKLLHGNAEGADQLVATIAKSIGISVVDVKEELFPEKEILEEADYEAIAQYLTQNADHLIALWDGIYNHKKGGTSEVVRMAMEGNRPMILHHLVTPRQENPYPVATLLIDGLSFINQKFQRIPFTVHFSWIDIQLPTLTKPKPKFSESIFKSSTFWTYLLPVLLVVFILGLGTYGFYIHDDDGTHLNDFFNAVNLITFNSSVIQQNSNGFLDIARILGLIFTFAAFGYGFFIALSKQRQKFNIWRWQQGKKYVLVLGLSEKSYDLIVDLRVNHKKKVVVLAPNEDSPYKSEVEKLDVIFIKGNIYSVSHLQELYTDKASEIYVLSDSDTDNARAMQELERISKSNLTGGKTDRFVHIKDTRQRNFLYDNLDKSTNNRSNIFNIYENISRRLLLYHPTDRFYQTPEANTACVVIIGFGDLGRQIAITCLRQGHYEEGKRLKIKVLCPHHIAKRNAFEKEFPYIKVDDDDKPHLAIIKKDIWKHTSIEFFELPKSDADLLKSDSEIFGEIKAENVVSIYACLENGLESAAYLTAMLPKLNYMSEKHVCNLQVFCFYNFPDKKEEKIIETNFNKLAPNMPVYCFGNFMDECSVEFIHNLALDALPKQIAYWYEQEYGDKTKVIEQVWHDCSEQDKEANRQAADHLWVKVRTVWHAIDWKFDPKTFKPLVPEREYKKYVEQLSEIEHRRWCADLLLKGVRPLQDEENAGELEGFWHNGGKKILKPQKLHLDLKPFKALSPHESQKDASQIEHIPEFLREIVAVK